ncbi:MAG: hypothetical protein ACRBCL_04075 [Maritimibacter sp.]
MDAYAGANLLPSDISLPAAWAALHDNAVQWHRLAGVPNGVDQRMSLTQSDRRLLGHFSQVDARHWRALCNASGITALGVIAEGWCSQCDFIDTLVRWSALISSNGDDLLLSARLCNFDVLPRFEKLSAALDWANGHDALAALIVLSQEAMVIDLPPADRAASAPLVYTALEKRGLL